MPPGVSGPFAQTLMGGGYQGSAPIDTSRPILSNPDGSFSTERTIGIEMDGVFYNIPTIVNGQQMSEDEAVRAFNEGRNPPVGIFASQAEADAAAVARSSEIGRVRGVSPRLSSPFMGYR